MTALGNNPPLDLLRPDAAMAESSGFNDLEELIPAPLDLSNAFDPVPLDLPDAFDPAHSGQQIEWPEDTSDFQLDESHAQRVQTSLWAKIAAWSAGEGGLDFDTDEEELGERSAHEEDTGSDADDRKTYHYGICPDPHCINYNLADALRRGLIRQQTRGDAPHNPTWFPWPDKVVSGTNHSNQWALC